MTSSTFLDLSFGKSRTGAVLEKRRALGRERSPSYPASLTSCDYESFPSVHFSTASLRLLDTQKLLEITFPLSSIVRAKLVQLGRTASKPKVSHSPLLSAAFECGRV
jgi:hypothetical protein